MLSHLSRKHSGVDLDTAQALPPSPTEEQHDQGMDVDAFETPAPNNDQEESQCECNKLERSAALFLKFSR